MLMARFHLEGDTIYTENNAMLGPLTPSMYYHNNAIHNWEMLNIRLLFCKVPVECNEIC
jgi:hypothetical protein